MYLGSFLMFFGLMITCDLRRYNGIFRRLSSIDTEFCNLFGTPTRIRDIERNQYRFELICILALSVAFVAISVYDLNVMYPP